MLHFCIILYYLIIINVLQGEPTSFAENTNPHPSKFFDTDSFFSYLVFSRFVIPCSFVDVCRIELKMLGLIIIALASHLWYYGNSA